MTIPWAIAFLLLLCVQQAPSSASGAADSVTPLLTGRLASSYGFQVQIPSGHSAIPSAMVGDHGVIISLAARGSNLTGTMEFFAAGNVLFWKSANEAATAHVAWLRERARKGAARVLSRKPTSLRGIPGVRVVATYQDKDSGVDTVSDELVLLRSREGGDRLAPAPDFAYSFGVVAPATEYADGRQVFEKVLATVRFVKPDE